MLDRDDFRRHLFGERSLRRGDPRRDGGGPSAGFALFFHNFSTWTGKPGIWLEDLFVRPQFRGQGHGKALLVELARLAVERGCGRLEWSVLDWNEPSIAFYKALGAKPMDEWTTFRVPAAPSRNWPLLLRSRDCGPREVHPLAVAELLLLVEPPFGAP